MESLAAADLLTETQSEKIFLCTKGKVADEDRNYTLTYMTGSHFKRNVKLTLQQKNGQVL